MSDGLCTDQNPTTGEPVVTEVPLELSAQYAAMEEVQREIALIGSSGSVPEHLVVSGEPVTEFVIVPKPDDYDGAVFRLDAALRKGRVRMKFKEKRHG